MRTHLFILVVIVTAAVGVAGQSQQRSNLFDSFGRINCGDAQARTDAFITRLSDEPAANGVVIMSPQSSDQLSAFALLQEIMTHFRMRRVDEGRVKYLIEAPTEDTVIQFWIERPGDPSAPPLSESPSAETRMRPIRKPVKFGSSVPAEAPLCGSDAYDLNVFAHAVNEIPGVRARVNIRARNAANATKLKSQIREELRQRGILGSSLRLLNVKSVKEGVELWLEPDPAYVETKTQSGSDRTPPDVSYALVISANREIEKYTRELLKYPEDVDSLIGRARAYASIDRTSDALVDLSKAIGLSKHPYYVAQAMTDRGKIFLKRKEYPKAVADFTAVIGTNGADAYKPRAYLARGEANLANGDRDAALADADAAIKLYTASKLSGKVKGLATARKLRAQILSAKRSK